MQTNRNTCIYNRSVSVMFSWHVGENCPGPGGGLFFTGKTGKYTLEYPGMNVLGMSGGLLIRREEFSGRDNFSQYGWNVQD